MSNLKDLANAVQLVEKPEKPEQPRPRKTVRKVDSVSHVRALSAGQKIILQELHALKGRIERLEHAAQKKPIP